jgi:hypothetical protein
LPGSDSDGGTVIVEGDRRKHSETAGEGLDLLVAGILGAAAITLPMYLARALGVVRLDLPMLLGSLAARPVWPARMVGLVPHLLASVWIFPSAYRAGFQLARTSPGIRSGLILAVPHWAASVAGMWLLGLVNPRTAGSGASPDLERRGRLLAPGAFGQRYGPLAPPAIVVGHLVYGAVVGWWLGRKR